MKALNIAALRPWTLPSYVYQTKEGWKWHQLKSLKSLGLCLTVGKAYWMLTFIYLTVRKPLSLLSFPLKYWLMFIYSRKGKWILILVLEESWLMSN